MPADDSGNGEEPPPDIPNAGPSDKESAQVSGHSLDGARTTNPNPSLDVPLINVERDNIHKSPHTLSAEEVVRILSTDTQ